MSYILLTSCNQLQDSDWSAESHDSAPPTRLSRAGVTFVLGTVRVRGVLYSESSAMAGSVKDASAVPAARFTRMVESVCVSVCECVCVCVRECACVCVCVCVCV